MHYLEIPVEVLGRADARELVRFWVCDGDADLLKHAIIAMRLCDPARDSAEFRQRMIAAFEERMAEPDDKQRGRLSQ